MLVEDVVEKRAELIIIFLRSDFGYFAHPFKGRIVQFVDIADVLVCQGRIRQCLEVAKAVR